jgi:hypothetical protein
VTFHQRRCPATPPVSSKMLPCRPLSEPIWTRVTRLKPQALQSRWFKSRGHPSMVLPAQSTRAWGGCRGVPAIRHALYRGRWPVVRGRHGEAPRATSAASSSRRPTTRTERPGVPSNDIVTRWSPLPVRPSANRRVPPYRTSCTELPCPGGARLGICPALDSIAEIDGIRPPETAPLKLPWVAFDCGSEGLSWRIRAGRPWSRYHIVGPSSVPSKSPQVR